MKKTQLRKLIREVIEEQIGLAPTGSIGQTQQTPIIGCTDSFANNYNPEAIEPCIGPSDAMVSIYQDLGMPGVNPMALNGCCLYSQGVTPSSGVGNVIGNTSPSGPIKPPLGSIPPQGPKPIKRNRPNKKIMGRKN